MVILKNKKAWLRIIEAAIGIILILASILIYYQINTAHTEDNFGELLPEIADEIAKDNLLRTEILDANSASASQITDAEASIKTFMQGLITRKDLDYQAEICNVDEDCTLTPTPSNLDGDIYSYPRILSTYLEKNNFDSATDMKKLNLYIWKKN